MGISSRQKKKEELLRNSMDVSLDSMYWIFNKIQVEFLVKLRRADGQ